MSQRPTLTPDAVKSLVQQHWDGRAAAFDEAASHAIQRPEQGAAWRRLIRQVAGARPLDALDVGCGTGFLALLLAEQGHRVTGIDIAPQMIERARAKAAAAGLAVAFRLGDVETLALPPHSLDLIVERHVVWTLPQPGLALDAWRRLLRPGGRLVMVEGHWGDMAIKDEYQQMHRELPLFGGRPAEQISQFVASRGYRDLAAEPLMDPALWTEPPKHPRFLVTAHAPA